jgi:hypothetical protein
MKVVIPVFAMDLWPVMKKLEFVEEIVARQQG